MTAGAFGTGDVATIQAPASTRVSDMPTTPFARTSGANGLSRTEPYAGGLTQVPGNGIAGTGNIDGNVYIKPNPGPDDLRFEAGYLMAKLISRLKSRKRQRADAIAGN